MVFKKSGQLKTWRIEREQAGGFAGGLREKSGNQKGSREKGNENQL